jgi:hypothetical protein
MCRCRFWRLRMLALDIEEEVGSRTLLWITMKKVH